MYFFNDIDEMVKRNVWLLKHFETYMRSYIKTEWQLYNEAKIHTAVGSWKSKSIGRLLRTIFQRSKVLVHSWPDKRFIHNYWALK